MGFLCQLLFAQYGRNKTERVSATEILCWSGADVDFQDRNGRTALQMAKDVECMCLILSYYGDPSIQKVKQRLSLRLRITMEHLPRATCLTGCLES